MIETSYRAAFQVFEAWRAKEDARVSYEWDKEWDGTKEHGVVLCERQDARIDAAKARCGLSDVALRACRAEKL